MATDPNNIRLGPDERELLAKLADKTGKDWDNDEDAAWRMTLYNPGDAVLVQFPFTDQTSHEKRTF